LLLIRSLELSRSEQTCQTRGGGVDADIS
jgi:hypothetical protein